MLINTHDSASYVTNNHGRINENSTPYAKINYHNSSSYLTHDHSRISGILASMHVPSTNSVAYDLFSKPGSIKWWFYFAGTYDVFHARTRKFDKYYFEKLKGQEYPDPDEIEARIMQEERHC